MKTLRRCKDPSVLKGTAFTSEERDRCGLQGLYSPHLAPLAKQVLRARFFASQWIPSYSPGRRGKNKNLCACLQQEARKCAQFNRIPKL